MDILIYLAFILVSISLIVLASYAIAIFIRMKKEKYKTDYFALFFLGIIWILVCLAMQKWILTIIGLIFAIISLSEKRNWKKNKMNWRTMKTKEKDYHKMLIIILFAVIIISGSVWWFSVKFC
jgi:hypothetical protein